MKTIEAGNKSMLDAEPAQLAAQITLIDLPTFKSIQRAELTSLGDHKRKHSSNISLITDDNGAIVKQTRGQSPNVVAMNRQFNRLTFWVVDQILVHESARTRAQVIGQSIKIARCLYQLNNLHSSYALVSALLSSPIYRLEKTWSLVRRKHQKEAQQLDCLRELFSDNNNYQLLRNHLAVCRLPCIPYLGMYSRDIIYTNEAHQEGSLQRTRNSNKILESIEKFQLSEYGDLVDSPTATSCLEFSTHRYEESSRKWLEDENYSRSLALEPAPILFLNYSKDQLPIRKDGSNCPTGNNCKKSSPMATLASLLQAALQLGSQSQSKAVDQTGSKGNCKSGQSFERKTIISS